MEIRKIQQKDAEAFQLYLTNLYKERVATLYLRDKAPSLEKLASSIKEYVLSDNALCLVAVDQDNIIACLNYMAYEHPQQAHNGDFTLSVAKQWRS